MTTKTKNSRRLWPYLAVPALAVLAAAVIYVADSTAEDSGTGGSESEGELPGSQADESQLADSPLQPDPEEQRAAAQDKLQGMFSNAVDDYLSNIEDENLYVSLAVSDSEFDLDYNGDEQHDTASIVKVEILAMLLLEYGSVEEIPDWAMNDAEAMIRESSNDATNSILFGLLDGHATMREAHPALGLEGTEPHESERWGLTQTTAVDQVTMVDTVLFEGLLDEEQVQVCRDFMGDLADFQQWGVSAAAAEDESVWMKNGWDVRDDLGGEWVVNSIGVIGGDTEDPIEMAILTGGWNSEEDGIAHVEELAQIAREIIDVDPYA